MSFTIPIRIDAGQTSAALAKVATELDRTERAGKAAGEVVAKALAEGTLSADRAKAATAAYANELASAERAAERMREKSQGIGGAFAGMKDSISSAFGGLPAAIGNLGLMGSAINGAVGGVMSLGSALLDVHLGILKMNDGLIEQRNLLRTVTDTQIGLTFAVADMHAISNRSLSDIKTTTDAYVRLKNATAELGLTSDHVQRITETMSKKFAMSGKSAGENAAAMLQLSQAIGSGVLQGDEFKSLSENAPDLLRAFARELGVTRGELKALSSEGKITTDVMISALDKMADATDASFSRMEKTSVQKTQALRNAMAADPNMAVNAARGDLGAMADIFAVAPDDFFGESVLSPIKEMEAEATKFNQAIATSVETASRLHDALVIASGGTIFKDESVASFDSQLKELLKTIERMSDPDWQMKKQIEDLEKLGGKAGTTTLAFQQLADLGIGGVIAKLGELSTGIDEPMLKMQKHVSDIGLFMFGDDVAKRGAWDNTKGKKPTGSGSEYRIGGAGDDGTTRELIDTLERLNAVTRDSLGMRSGDRARDTLGMDVTSTLKGEALKRERDRYREKKLTDDWNQRSATTDPSAMSNALDALERQATDVAGAMEAAFTNAYQGIENGIVKMVTTGKVSFSGLVNSMLADLTRLATRKLFMSLIGAFSGGGGGYAIGGLASADEGPGLHFASGGSFMVGGSGGTDTTPVQFRATPGERVIVQTPEQQRASDAGGGNGRPGAVSVHNHFDKRELLQALDGPDGERVVHNIIRKNAGAIRGLLGR